MPNICSNTLWVVGRPKFVNEFLDKSRNPRYGKLLPKDDELPARRRVRDSREWAIFENHLPCPKELRDTQAIFYSNDESRANQIMIESHNLKTYGAKHWYDWCLDNWGTKWGDYDTSLDASGRHGACLSFSTAWSPGTAGLEKISALHPELVFVNAYEESGCDFIGCDVFYRGKKIHGGSGGFPQGPDDWEDWEMVDAYELKVEATRGKWLKKAVSKLEKKSHFHAKKLKSLAR